MALRIVVAVALAPTLVIAIYSVAAPPITPLMLLRALDGSSIDYRWVPFDRISPAMFAAVVASEDNRFCSHRGFDAEAIGDEIEDWIQDGRPPRGASTITQQTAKNILLWPGRDLLRKAIEAALTPQIELLWSKRRILEVYLNIIEVGPGVYGVEAAARRFFGKPASELSLREASLIAAVLPAPLRRSVRDPAMARRGERIRRRAAQIGDLLGCVGTTPDSAERSFPRPPGWSGAVAQRSYSD